MDHTLSPCRGCARHLRAGSTHCPFCGVSQQQIASAGRRTTAALAALALGGALGATGCEQTTRAAPVYGAPPPRQVVNPVDGGLAPADAATPSQGTR